MSNQSSTDPNTARLERLLSFAQEDRENPSLLRDIAGEAMRVRAYGQAAQAVARLRELGLSEGGDEAAAIHALVKTGNSQEASRIAVDALERWPDDEGVRLEGARAWLNLRRFDEAVEWARGPFRDDAIGQMAAEITVLAHWHAQRLDAAEAVGREALASWPGNPRLLSSVSAILFDLDRAEDAFAMAQQAQDISPAHAYETLHVLASRSLLHRDLDEAQRWIDQAQKVRTDDGRIWLLRGSVGLIANRHEEAIADLKKALDIYPEHPGTHLTLAWLYIIQKRLSDAEATIQAAIAVSPAFAESHGTLAVVHALAGHEELARASIRRATLLDREGFAARYAQNLLAGSNAAELQELVSKLVLKVGLR